MHKWLSVIGIGEDGLDGLSAVARSHLQQAEILVGGTRHLAFLPPDDLRPQVPWGSPLSVTLEKILSWRGQPVCILASGDPMCYGIGATLCRRVPLSEMTIVPAPSAFSWACARLGWLLTEVETFSLCGRDPAFLNARLYPGARLLVLSADGHTPAQVADQLTQQGLGASTLVVLERLGGPQERQWQGTAATWQQPEVGDLNTLAITIKASDPTRSFYPPHGAGLPDSAYHHDGQLTKREVRAITLATLAPLPGQRLWDVGAGCGSISIEWLRSHPRCEAIAIEPHPQRRQYIADNATALGTPHLQVVSGRAPAALKPLPTPDAIFIGGGVTTPGLLEYCWQVLPEGGRLVVNGVTVESEQQILQGYQQWGGDLTRIAIQHPEPVGRFLGWKAMTPITQWAVVKR
ncbi:precorrin-6y C5,15-methyltransferase (decarboxylating) subunit CbiE [Synechococcales cyanobacterium C]|uniref:Precorrin-6y C5,15-methyltransferase (Decarboxylating) subunit CbiE n=1 Tax=Petrachloros mirabilis ULC683 TaxID=2781853 RepID=A0A8K1ZVZ1_9CYAN|nr:precorrin-6y C5,15-methyltransferase (decarboxylating) subunit CbiE [Petrachloros mirabilis]NCJ05096.1 precorrin-6y C5,15-methyltransferase (decarboxylating) subunit CbiE [Petrachloros mirabilis ULC683]